MISETDRIQIEAAIDFMREDASVPCITVALTLPLTSAEQEVLAPTGEYSVTISRHETLEGVLKRVGYIDPATIDPRRQDLYVGRPDYDPYERSHSGFNYRRFDSWPKWLREVIKHTPSGTSNRIAAIAMADGAKALERDRARLEALKEFADVRPHRVPGRERKAGVAWALQGLGRRMVRGSRGRRGRHLYD